LSEITDASSAVDGYRGTIQ